MFEKLVKDALGHLTDNLQRAVLKDLKAKAKNAVAKQIAASCGRAVIKGIDGVVAVAVDNLSQADARKLLDTYTTEVGKQLADLFDGIEAYVPMALKVELAKAEFGSDSVEANKARSERNKGITELREECRDFLNVIIGEDPKD